ncbi:hypothetical protein, partial [Klebsiella pasteurii]|uniref:hypothetical protein n=1 Tax=Klebsiella pasteurii TaxID=2587529 RepID=UPI00287BD5E5
MQDDSLRSPFGQRYALCKIVPNNFVDSNLRQVRILHIADSKKAPLGRFFTLVGRAGFEPATN